MRRLSLVLASASVSALAACAGTQDVWYKPGATHPQFAADRDQCATLAGALRGGPGFAQQGVYDDCMKQRGWVLKPKAPTPANS